MGRKIKDANYTSLNKQDVIKGFAEEYGTNFVVAKNIYDSLMNYIAKLVSTYDEISISPLGTFRHKTRKGRKFRLPDGELSKVPDKIVLSFYPAKDFRDMVMQRPNQEVETNKPVSYRYTES